MAASLVARFAIDLTDLGDDKQVSCRAAISDTPTQGALICRSVDSALATVLLPGVGIVSGELVALYLYAKAGDIYIDPFSTAITTARSCFIAEGQFNYYTYLSGTTVIPSFVVASAGSQVEYLFAAVT